MFIDIDFSFIYCKRSCNSIVCFDTGQNTGIEARGFIFGPPIALAIGAKFVPMRKPKKLPGTSSAPMY